MQLKSHNNESGNSNLKSQLGNDLLGDFLDSIDEDEDDDKHKKSKIPKKSNKKPPMVVNKKVSPYVGQLFYCQYVMKSLMFIFIAHLSKKPEKITEIERKETKMTEETRKSLYAPRRTIIESSPEEFTNNYSTATTDKNPFGKKIVLKATDVTNEVPQTVHKKLIISPNRKRPDYERNRLSPRREAIKEITPVKNPPTKTPVTKSKCLFVHIVISTIKHLNIRLSSS